MGMVSEFKEFALKGNMMDMAVGIIIGAAFGKIVDSLVADVIMPIVSKIFGGDLNFDNMYAVWGEIPAGVENNYAALKEAGVNVFAYGAFITALINFVILAFIIFMLVKAMNKMRKAKEEAPEAPSEEVLLLREIRDGLNK